MPNRIAMQGIGATDARQRAFQIVCYMVGADATRFKDLAAETKLPQDRQQSCSEDYRKQPNLGAWCSNPMCALPISRKQKSTWFMAMPRANLKLQPRWHAPSDCWTVWPHDRANSSYGRLRFPWKCKLAGSSMLNGNGRPASSRCVMN